MPNSLDAMTFRQTAERYPAFTEAALRWLRFNGYDNGFDKCVIKLGRRVLIDAGEFERWLERHRAGA
jgi:hypothetical protein